MSFFASKASVFGSILKAILTAAYRLALWQTMTSKQTVLVFSPLKLAKLSGAIEPVYISVQPCFHANYMYFFKSS